MSVMRRPLFRAPINVGILNRSESDCDSLRHSERWFCPREQVLTQCIQKDLSQRDLSDVDKLRAWNLDTGAPVRRIILAELLHRGLHLHRFAMKYGYIMDPQADTSPVELMSASQRALTGAHCSDNFFCR